MWTSSLSLYQVLTENVIEEALCDVYNERYAKRGSVLEPNQFHLEVSFNFCLKEGNRCPDYELEAQKADGLLWDPRGVDASDPSGYMICATLRTSPLSLAEKIHALLTNDERRRTWILSRKRRRCR